MRGLSLNELLARRAAARPEQPWLFFPEGPDWRWRSLRSVAEMAAGRTPPVAALVPVVELLAGPDVPCPPPAWQLLPPAPGTRGGEVTVLTRAPSRPAGRLLVAWSLLAAGALVVEPAAAARVGSAVWARPSLFLGDAGEVAALAAAAARFERGRPGHWWRRVRAAAGRPAPPRRPFGRLHTLVLAPPAPGTPPAAVGVDTAFWRRRGVCCVDLRGVLF